MKLTRVEMEARRLQGAEMLRDGISQAIVARQVGVTRTTASRWQCAVKAGEGLERRKAPGRPCRLSGEQLRSLYALWETRARWTTASFAEAIRTVTGVKYDPDHVGRLIVRLGLRPARKKRDISDRYLRTGQMDLTETEARA